MISWVHSSYGRGLTRARTRSCLSALAYRRPQAFCSWSCGGGSFPHSARWVMAKPVMLDLTSKHKYGIFNDKKSASLAYFAV
jgi:hypothetical protein